MSAKIILHFLNHVYSRIETETSIAREIYDEFSYLAPNYRFHPKFKNKQWDGQIHLLKWSNKIIYTGLVEEIAKFCNDREYELILEGFPEKEHPKQVFRKAFENAIKSFKIPEKFEARDYQIKTFEHCIHSRRCVLVSPTASGKSLIIYYILRFLNKRALIIVPNTNLIHQMAQDFLEYGYQEPIHKIFSGQEKESNAQIQIGTWQSVYKMPQEFFSKFEVIIGDECHHFKAKSLIELMEKTSNIGYRFGFTGSLDDTNINKLTLEGLFGSIKQFVTSKNLMDKGYISNLEIKTILLKYPEEICKSFTRKIPYEDEIDWLIQNQVRNKFIKNLTFSLTGNTLILYRFIEKHGKPLFKLINEEKKDCPVYFISGAVKSKERDELRKIVNEHQNSIVVASTGCFSEGVNIPNINNIILATPSKSRILVMQMIGRGLRKNEGKDTCQVFDIADDLSFRKRKNFSYKHYLKRLQYYLEENFNFKEYETKL